MDIFKKDHKKLIFTLLGILLIVVISLVLYSKPLFSNKPLGLDALGHVSKISYLKEFGLSTQWDMAWYNGAPFLEYYSPLYYYAGYFFENIIFGANFLSFLSIVLAAIGIFFLIKHYTKNKTFSLIFGLFFLSVLCTSYYYVSVGNHPYVFAIFTIPFTLLFLEKSLENKKRNFFFYCLFFVLAYLTHIFIALVLFLLVGLRILFHCYFNRKEKILKKLVIEGFIFLAIPLLIASFWFLPFLSKSGSFIGDGIGYIPAFKHLLGFGNYIIWGKAAGEIGILFGLFIASLLFLKKFIKEKDEKVIFLLTSSILLFLLLEGILGKFYPTGVGAIRFIVPFSILACVFSGTVFGKKFGNNKKVIFLLVFILLIALFINYKTINENYEKYSYNSLEDRWGMVEGVYGSEEFPLGNNFSNYRFGTSRYIFSETLNYKFPWQSQTWGYFDQGILYPQKMNAFKETVWGSHDINKTLYFLDSYAIKYLEVGGQDLKFDNKFNQKGSFDLIIEENFSDYPFKIYEYKYAKPIISVVLENGSYETLDKFNVERSHPDEISVNYPFSGEESLLFKESFHNSWKAKDSESGKRLKIDKTSEGFMVLNPPRDVEVLLIYQSNTLSEVLGIFISLAGIFLMLVLNRTEK